MEIPWESFKIPWKFPWNPIPESFDPSSGISLGYINSWVALRLVSHLWYVLVSHGE